MVAAYFRKLLTKKNDKMVVETIKFNHKGKKIKWNVVHNLIQHGLSLESAFVNWAARVKDDDVSFENFVNYVQSKGIKLTIYRVKNIKK